MDFNLGTENGVNAGADAEGMVFDLNNVEENKSFEIMPKGTYGAVVDELEYKLSAKGNPMLALVFSITDAEYENRKVYDYYVLSGDGSQFGLAKVKKFLARVCPEVDLGSFNPQKFSDSGDAIGRECQLILGIQTQKSGDYKGEKRNTVKDIQGPSNSGSFM